MRGKRKSSSLILWPVAKSMQKHVDQNYKRKNKLILCSKYFSNSSSTSESHGSYYLKVIKKYKSMLHPVTQSWKNKKEYREINVSVLISIPVSWWGLLSNTSQHTWRDWMLMNNTYIFQLQVNNLSLQLQVSKDTEWFLTCDTWHVFFQDKRRTLNFFCNKQLRLGLVYYATVIIS